MPLLGRHILSSEQFERGDLDQLFALADRLRPAARGLASCRVLEGAVLASLFFEPSTRTRLSFESAFAKLGGSVISTSSGDATSVSKGESLADTSRVVSGYSDVLVVRHPAEPALREFAGATRVPVINGGNGAGEHPTQALLDLYTLERECARLGTPLDGRRIALVGDLRHGRTVHSLVRLLSLYRDLTLVCVSPAALRMPADLLALCAARGHRVEETDRPDTGLRNADVVYATRLQRERLGGESPEYGEEFRITGALVDACCHEGTVLMHPLPRDTRPGAIDLDPDLDADPRLAVFRQTDGGVAVRMALFASVLGVAEEAVAALRPAGWYRPEQIGVQDAPFHRVRDLDGAGPEAAVR
ncbi:aspartate carbamoyltransferase [Streptomyces sp. NPDC057682]|uniref:aspartate carbamoyltransferase n=1 Tax=Streptomyces sp. NPDC057682 TaxID=3346210 RepID=UPI0036CDFC33